MQVLPKQWTDVYETEAVSASPKTGKSVKNFPAKDRGGSRRRGAASDQY